ncbi:uncharacterized protein LOC143064241 isoform X2 [Mytilus galloprovincialis]|uniref:uncharacterized protein LOC143064241 isoform X2 n=1 Tax=Mytilus galloprovincialis TaxID=29158 RepID=UPI003F7CB5AE
MDPVMMIMIEGGHIDHTAEAQEDTDQYHGHQGGQEDPEQDPEHQTEEDQDQDLMTEGGQGAEVTKGGHTVGQRAGHMTDREVETDHVHTVDHHHQGRMEHHEY